MSRVLILFGTTDGHTAKIAARLRDDLHDAGAAVHLVDAGAGHADPMPMDYDAVIVAASVQMGGYQRAVRNWVARHARDLSGTSSAFISVSLGILQPEPEVQREVHAIMDRFLTETGWRPTITLPVAGALPYSRYGWFKRWGMQRMARKAGVETDTSRDYEYTDWNALHDFAASFVKRSERVKRVLALH